jgi:hypothetical protein
VDHYTHRPLHVGQLEGAQHVMQCLGQSWNSIQRRQNRSHLGGRLSSAYLYQSHSCRQSIAGLNFSFWSGQTPYP